MSLRNSSCQVAVIGAGPYGLAVASQLRAFGTEVRVFGKAMDFWQNQMPKGMLLRSPWDGSHIGDLGRAYTLDRYEAALGTTLPCQLPLEEFVRYGQWFQQHTLPDLDPRNIVRVEDASDRYRVELEDGERFTACSVVVATGIGPFANCPAPYSSLPLELASHTSSRLNRDLGRFASRRVAVVGAGQSAVESAVLLREAGAEVELLVRSPRLRWLKTGTFLQWVDENLNPFPAPGKVGPMLIDWLIENPGLFSLTPRSFQKWAAYRALRPAASAWLRSRAEGLRITEGRHAVTASERAGKVHLQLDDGSQRTFDHVLLGTGYKVDIARYGFLSRRLLAGVRTAHGHPLLNRGFESSRAGLYFVGATAAYSFGPLCRFVAGTRYTAAVLSRHARKQPASSGVSYSAPLGLGITTPRA